MSRIVVTGVGIISPLGVGIKQNWQSLISGKSGIISTKELNDRGYENIPSKVFGKVPEGSLKQGKWSIEDHLEKGEARRLATFSQYALACTNEALQDAKFLNEDQHIISDPLKIGVAVGSGMGSFQDIYDNSTAFHTFGYKKIQPLFIPKLLNNMAAGNISIKYGLKGPLHSVSTACATGVQSIGDAYNFLKNDYCDVMICGGTESSVHPLALGAFARARSVTTNFNDEPEKASRPFDGNRSGFVMSEGCGILILEKLENAIKRGLNEQNIYGEIVGYGLSGDAYHITAPREDGDGAYNAMDQAIKRGKINSNDVDYVNAHATSTVVGDRAENNAMMRLFDKSITVSATKSSTGHLLGAAGAIESIFTIMSVKTREIPPTLNLDNLGQHEDDDFNQFTRFDYVPNKSKIMDINYALCNSFGFGGVNSSILFKKFS
ncbi:unnamed protein product [Candida verbasci]|uniref:3-oxoacyl-[acyl-carrier-protein] synthase n=1 Tax=Candida verbasci TaxID=1227364 RepID=A0A9W4XDY2_9ASCO|nr:unnamed protein product [Candida verbasci]